MTKSATLAVAALAASFLGPPQTAAGQLTYSWPSNVGPLNPHLYAPNQMFAQASLYEPLVKYRDDGSVEPWLATSWNISEDGRTYDFVLRPGVTFSDGVPFDAAAVKANFDAILANRPRHAWLDLVQQIERTEVVGPLAFRLVLKAPHYPTLLELSLPRPFRFLSPKAMGPGGTTAVNIRRRSAQGRGGSSTPSSAFPTRSRATRVTGARDPSSTGSSSRSSPILTPASSPCRRGRSTSSTARADRFLRKPSSDFETWPELRLSGLAAAGDPGARDELRALPDR